MARVEVVVIMVMALLFSAQASENTAQPNDFIDCYNECYKNCHLWLKLLCIGRCVNQCKPPPPSTAAPLPAPHLPMHQPPHRWRLKTGMGGSERQIII
ncbi:hypothetical protein ACP275_09G079800 [Erythranthe tilingii]